MNGTSPRIRVNVTCGICHERLTTVAKPYERKMKCPECDGTVRVPAYDPIEADFLRRLQEPRNVDPGVYGIMSREDSEQPVGPLPETVLVKCPTCLSLLHPEVREESWRDTCPDCQEEYRVPARSEIPEKPQPMVIPDPGRYQTGEATKPAPFNTHIYEQISAIKQVELDLPPKWTFFSQVYLYPWSKYVWPRWIWMSIGWTFSWALISAVTYFIMLGGLSPIAGAFFALPAFWFTFMSLSYSAACGMTVLEGTAAGQQTIDEWPDPDWREWAAKLLYLAFIGLLTQGVAAGVTFLTALPGLEWFISIAALHVFYPIILLSALETTNPFWPVSKPVLNSMATHTRFWILYFLISCSCSALFLGVAWVSISIPFIGALWMGPLIATMIVLQTRLLGRLGWRTVVEPDGGKKRLKKLAKIKNWTDTPIGKFEPVPPETRS